MNHTDYEEYLVFNYYIRKGYSPEEAELLTIEFFREEEEDERRD